MRLYPSGKSHYPLRITHYERSQSLTAKDTKDAKEKRSLTAKDANDIKEARAQYLGR